MSRLALLLSVCVLPVFAAHGQFLVPEGSDYHNGATLPSLDDGTAEAALLRLERAVLAGDDGEVVHLLRTLRGELGDSLVPFGPRTHVPALERAARLVMTRASDAVRRDVLEQEQLTIATARRFRDLPRLLDRATRGTALPTSREAAWSAALLLFEQGSWWEAAGLAARAGDRAGSGELVAAAAGELPVTEVREPRGPWQLAYSFSYQLDDEEEAPLPLFVDGRPGELLRLDFFSLDGLDLAATTLTIARTFEPLLWITDALEKDERYFVSLPSPRRYTMARSGERCVLPFNVARLRRRRLPRNDRQANLLAVDLGSPPSVAWRASATPGETSSSAFGPVTVAGDRVFAQLFRTGLDTEVSLVAYALDDGRLLFETPLVRGPTVQRYSRRQVKTDVRDIDKRAPEGVVAVRDGIVYACTGYGVVAAVDGITGDIRHTFHYDRLFSLEQGRYDRSYLFDTGGWHHEPVRLFGERVVVAPSDSRYLYMLASEPGPRGHLILDDPIERLDRVDIVDLRPDPAGGASPAVVATTWRDDLSSIVMLEPDGHVRARGEPLPPGERQLGRPVTIGTLILVPTDAGVRMFDVDDVTRPPGLIPAVPGLPPPRAVHPFADGLVLLCPDPDGVVHVLYWQQV